VKNYKQLTNSSFKLKINKPGSIKIPGLGLIKIDEFNITIDKTTKADLSLSLTTAQYKKFIKTQNPQVL